MSDKQFANETVKVVEMTTEIDKAGAHQFSKARREDGVGGVVTEPDGDICFMRGLRSDIHITSTLLNYILSWRLDNSLKSSNGELCGEKQSNYWN